jgi:glutathione S-transferase
MAQRKRVSRTSGSKKPTGSKKTVSKKSKVSKKPARKLASAKKAPAKVQARRAAAPKAKRAAKKPAVRKVVAPKPVELYYWPTPNGWKISIFLEEARLPYVLKPVNIGRGEQFTSEFLKISPNNRMPAIVDPAGPGGKPLSVFESGAILRYLAEKTGKFYPADARGKAKVDEWLFWQVGGLGPMAGQLGHFRLWAKEKIPYAIDRYADEVNRLLGVLENQLKGGQDFIAGRYSIADMAIFPWVFSIRWGQSDVLDQFPALKAWVARMEARPGVKKGLVVGEDLRQQIADPAKDDEARKILLNQRARVA